MSLKSVTILLGIFFLRTEKCPQKALRFFWINSNKLKDILKKRYGSFGQKLKT